jgi:hypothetical protein
MTVLRLTQLVAQKTSLLSDVLTVGVGLLVVLFGRRFNAGFRSHTQQIVIGLSTAAIAQMGVRGIWQQIALHAAPQTQAEYEHVLGIQEKLYNANSVLFIAVLVWWIACLWINEPGPDSAAGLPAAVEAPSAEADGISTDQQK